MREELIRVENGASAGRTNSTVLKSPFPGGVHRGLCGRPFYLRHRISGPVQGRHTPGAGTGLFLRPSVGPLELERWILQNARIVNWHRFHSQELTVRDFLLALDRPAGWPQRWGAVRRLHSPESQEIRQRMELRVPLESRLADLSLLDYYRLCVFRVWFWRGELLVLDRITEILRRRDVEKLMECVQLLLRQGTAVFLLDLDETFMYRYCDRIDVIRDRRTCYRLYPEEYGERLYAVLGWKPRDRGAEHTECRWEDKQVLAAGGSHFSGNGAADLPDSQRRDRLLPGRELHGAARLRECFLGGRNWLSGMLWLNGQAQTHEEMTKQIGTEIGIQTERPDRPGGVLFDNLTALDNLTTCLLPKAGYRLVRRRVAENILEEASRWFPERICCGLCALGPYRRASGSPISNGIC